MVSYVHGVPVPAIGETGWGEEMNDFLTSMGNAYIDVSQAPYGCDMTGATDSTTAFLAAIDDSLATNGTVFIPPGVLKVTSTIDMSARSGVHFVGGQYSQSSMSGVMPPHTWIDGSSIASGPVFYWSVPLSGATSANITFENLMIGGHDQAVHIRDGANMRFKNCGLRATNTAASRNTALLLQNCFWIDAFNCSFLSPSATKYGVTILTEDVTNVPPGLMRFDGCRYEGGGGANQFIVNDDMPNFNGILEFNYAQVEDCSLPFLSWKEEAGCTTAWTYKTVRMMQVLEADQIVSNLPLIDFDCAHGTLQSPIVSACNYAVGMIRRAGTISGAEFYGMQGTPAPMFIYDSTLNLDSGSTWRAQVGDALTIHGNDVANPVENEWWRANGTPPLRIYRSGDTHSRYGVDSAGKTWWGPGVAAAWDTNLYRNAADQLKTDDKLLTATGLGVGNSAAATVLGSVVKKMQVFDASGNSLGYLAIYDAIT